MVDFVDQCFMKHSLASEAWLVHYLTWIKKTFPHWWSSSYESQLEDEVRHTQMCRDILESEGIESKIVKEISIQVALYADVGRLDFTQVSTKDEFSSVLNIIERRAKFLYKMYLRKTRNQKFKAVIQQILADELSHIAMNPVLNDSDFVTKAKKADQHIFGQFLPAKYSTSPRNSSAQKGIEVFVSQIYWQDLMTGRVSQSDQTAMVP